MARKKRFGDRNDGYRLRTLDPFYNFIPFIMARRSDAWTLFEDAVEITDTDRWLREKRKEGYKGLGYLHLFIAAYVRVVSQRPMVNRFVCGRRIYARNNIEIVMAVRRGMSSDAGETTIKVVFEPTDTVFDVDGQARAALVERHDIDECFEDVGLGNDADDSADLRDDRQAADFLLVHDERGFLDGRVLIDGDDILLHDIAAFELREQRRDFIARKRRRGRRRDAHDVLVGEEADELAVLDDWQAAEAAFLHQARCRVDAGVRRDDGRILCHAVGYEHVIKTFRSRSFCLVDSINKEGNPFLQEVTHTPGSLPEGAVGEAD